MFNCTGNKNNAAEADAPAADTLAVEAPAVVSYAGTYEGTLPCADCPGIKTTLVLNDADATYSLRQEYLNKEDGIFEENGTYEVNGDLIKLITPSSGELTYYKAVDGNVVLSDENGTINDGELKDFYVLTKQ